MLREEKYFLNDSGNAKSSDKNYAAFIPNLKFAFRASAKAHGSTVELDKSGFQKLDALLSVRHRITHPKRFVDLEILDEECKLTTDVWNWYSEQSVRLMRDCMTNRNPARQIARVASSLVVTKPFVLLWPDGTAYQFSTRRGLFGFLKQFPKEDKDAKRAFAVSFHKGAKMIRGVKLH